ncbi:MAG TPA: 2Fe-2S iron-sulfur cluster-binding protein [Myxococcales bacterium LLY-WYZ-16_1]|jgi:2Fe-2S ferredoxin|nr:2Fe-2S iron-sulfur cluster-binding protein [Myxococcales bacterium LLY-WYZ-16_1]
MPRITFKKNRVMTEDKVVEVEDGETILEAAEHAGIPVGSNCGGVCGCSTCHVYVIRGFDSLEEMDDPEADRLDLAFDVKLNSRLGCQAEVAGEDLVVDISEESLKAFFDENPAIRQEYEQTGVFPYVPRHGHHH